ncbi:MAG: hypothetical protein IPP40_04090 [bacterium]|nr:hypothetical protein [bacterium]
MSSKSLSLVLFVVVVITNSVLAQPDSLRREWKLLAAQNELIKSNNTYLVLDNRDQSFTLKLGSAVVWVLKEDSGTAKLNVTSLISKFEPDTTFLFAISNLRLMEYEPRFPDTLLKIVSEAMDMDPSLLQREIPVAFEIKWRNGPTLLVHSTPENQPVVIKVPWREKLGKWLDSFKENNAFEVQTNREIALTLYRVLKAGALTMVLR